MPIDRPSSGDKPSEPHEPADRGRGYGHIDEDKISDEELASYFGIELDDEPIELDENQLAVERARIADRSAKGEGFQTITRGEWYSSEPGWGHIESGGRNMDGSRDDLAVKADELIKQRTPFPQADAMNHVEMKLAAHMVRDEVQLMPVAINRQVCIGPRSCDALLEKILPEGYKLRVYQGDDTMKLYEGKWKGSA